MYLAQLSFFNNEALSKLNMCSKSDPGELVAKDPKLVLYIYKTRLSPVTQFFNIILYFLYRFHCYTDHQELNMTLRRNDVSNVTSQNATLRSHIAT